MTAAQMNLIWSEKQHIVCYSGGESSARVAIEVAERFGTNNLVLINHDICDRVEDRDIKRFKAEVAAYLGLPITYANYLDPDADQFDVCMREQAFKTKSGQEICTSRLKTEPFMEWLSQNIPDKNCIIYYGFDANERVRIQRRSQILGSQGYATDFPLALWPELRIQSVREIGIQPPNTYSVFKHANCVGCLKAGWQHWYVVYCTRPDIWEKGKLAEEEIGYAIHHDKTGPVYLVDMEPRFAAMKAAGISATEHIPQQRFWADAKKLIKIEMVEDQKPCECVF